MIHTSFGHKIYSRDEVLPQLLYFAEHFAALPFSVALDLSGELAQSYEILGTPHWLIFCEGKLLRSIYGSQDNAQLRLAYALEECLEASARD
ncbi:MAG: hypothetical protein R2865_00105 [Deinococcales bacterium]